MMKAVLTCVIAVALLSNVSYAQNKSWRSYSLPDSSFSIELPAPLRKVMSFEGEHGASLEPDQKIQWATCYAAIETSPEDSRFGIIIIGTKFLRKIRRLMSRKELLTSLSYTFFADDDETQYLRRPVGVQQNGLTGREYFYVKEHSLSCCLYTRGRIFDAGSRIYVLVFVGRDSEDLRSPAANRFLNTFRLRWRNRN
jgi:hypothetical protein